MRIYNIRTTILRLFLACYMIGLTYFSLRPAATGDAMAASVSWGLHVIAYAVFGILVGVAFPQWFERNRIRSILVIVAFGFVLELIQLFIAGRSFSWIDVGMNAVGASFSWFVPLVSGYLSPDAEEDRNQQIERPDRSSRQAGDLEGQSLKPNTLLYTTPVYKEKVQAGYNKHSNDETYNDAIFF